MVNRQQTDDSRHSRHMGSLTWALIAAVVSACLVLGACALWLPDRAPHLLGSPGEVTSAPASIQQYSGARQVTVVPSMSPERNLIGNANGTVTQDWSGKGLNSGSAAYKVNERGVVALATASPLYRDLKSGDTGEDVRALNSELNRLGYASAADSDAYTWATSNGWKQLMLDNGNTSDGSLSLADVLWIPAPSVSVSSWNAGVGSIATAGSPIGAIGGSIAKLTIKNGQPADQNRTITVFGQSTVLPAGSISITDPIFCAKVMDTPDFKQVDKSALPDGFDASLSLEHVLDVLRVPAAAVFGIQDHSGCIAPVSATASANDGDAGQGANDSAKPGTPIKVSIVGGDLGASLVQPQEGQGDLRNIRNVVIGGILNTLQCK